MAEVIPAIIPESFDELKDKLSLVSDFVSSVQIDVIDGDFAPPITWPYTLGDEFPEDHLPFKDDLNLEIDLLVSEPGSAIDGWIEAGAKAIIIHMETTEDALLLGESVKEAGVKVGFSINPSTKNEVLDEVVGIADFVQFMGNDKIGYQGVELDENVYEKIKDFKKKHPKVKISVDIGVNFKTAPKLIKAGVKKLVSGSTIYESEDLEEAVKKLKESK